MKVTGMFPAVQQPHGRHSQTGRCLPTHVAPALRRKGRQRHFAGHAAEDQVARHYREMGGAVLSQNCRTPEGEIDLIAQHGEVLIFIEVKQRKRLNSFDNPISNHQWRRLENSALHYITTFVKETGVHPVCRFDVALMGHDGNVQIIENARSFDHD